MAATPVGIGIPTSRTEVGTNRDLGATMPPSWDPEETLSPEHLRQLLANCLARLEQLTDLNAGDFLIERERELGRGLIAKLEPSDAEAVLRAWPRGAKLLERGSSDSRAKGCDNRPN